MIIPLYRYVLFGQYNINIILYPFRRCYIYEFVSDICIIIIVMRTRNYYCL